MPKVTVTNTAKGIRGLYDVDGLVNLAPGESRSLEMTEAEIKSAKITGNFDFGAKSAEPSEPQGDGLDSKKVSELDEIIADEKVVVPETGSGANDNVIAADKIAAIRAHRAAPPAPPQGDGLDSMGDDELRATVKTLTGQDAPADADRPALLALARGN